MKSARRRKDRESTTDHQHSWSMLTTDLMFNIFSRLSLKSIAICRCVSKQCAFLLDHSDFKDLRLTRSQASPRLLFACRDYSDKAFFLSTPHPQSPSSPGTDYHHKSFSFDYPVEYISTTSVNGFVMVDESVICNPSTGRSFTIPRMNTREETGRVVSFLGYDPVAKLHKVLAMICLRDDRTVDHQVLTLGRGGGTWRMVERGVTPCVSSGYSQHLCINGVLYYTEAVTDGRGRDLMIVCFDVRSEDFSFVKFPERYLYPGLIDCNGRLALVVSGSLFFGSEEIEMWVLRDPERCEWSKLVYALPPMWKDVVDPREWLEIVGVTGSNEIVMSPAHSSDPFHVYYFSFEKETVTRAVIRGMGAFGNGRTCSVRTYLNHVEDVKVMEL